MNVTFIAHVPVLLGANRSLLNLIDGLKEHGVTPFVVVPDDGELKEELKRRNIPVKKIPIQWWMTKVPPPVGLGISRIRNVINFYTSAAHRLRENKRLLPGLCAQLQEWKTDVVYTNSMATPVGAFAAKRLRLPHVWHIREFGDLDYNLHFDRGKTDSGRLLNSADAIIAISKAVSAHLPSGVNKNKVHVIYNGVATLYEFDSWRQQALQRYKPGHRFTFVIVGVIRPEKGQEIAIRAIAIAVQKIPDVRLLVVGPGDSDYLKKLKKLAADNGVGSNVEFRDYVTDPMAAFLEGDVALMCSKSEAMGRVTIEAMAACRTVIGCDTGATSELIEHRATGLLYKGGPESLAACMLQCIMDPAWSAQLGINGWAVARGRFTQEIYSEKVNAVLQDILQLKKCRKKQ